MPVIKVRDIESGELKWSAVGLKPGDQMPVRFSPDGTRLAYAIDDILVFLDVESGELVSRIDLKR